MGESLTKIIKETGTNLVGEVKYIKLGGLPFIGGALKDAEKADILGWAHGIVNNIQ